jgi:hypothetical protein
VVSANWAITENNASAILKQRRAAATVPFVSGPIVTTGGTVCVLLMTYYATLCGVKLYLYIIKGLTFVPICIDILHGSYFYTSLFQFFS